jgi:hypothetical protein
MNIALFIPATFDTFSPEVGIATPKLPASSTTSSRRLLLRRPPETTVARSAAQPRQDSAGWSSGCPSRGLDQRALRG